ncbi:MAG: metallophosphoesterase family protein [Bacteroidia bacterium]|nr:metallophosphoesterase family protein [Bacteroidia bacterium]
MRIAILSDTHDHVWHLRATLAAPEIQACETLICCGDLCSPFMMTALMAGFSGDIHVVFGNNDADLLRITRHALKAGDRVTLHGELAELTLSGKRIAIQHFDHIARGLAASGLYDYVCFGHNHEREVSQITAAGRTVTLLNPGPVMGLRFAQGQPVPTPATCMVLDLSSGAVQAYEIQDVTPTGGRLVPC